jgi:hypothetical protein
MMGRTGQKIRTYSPCQFCTAKYTAIPFSISTNTAALRESSGLNYATKVVRTTIAKCGTINTTTSHPIGTITLVLSVPFGTIHARTIVLEIDIIIPTKLYDSGAVYIYADPKRANVLPFVQSSEPFEPVAKQQTHAHETAP